MKNTTRLLSLVLVVCMLLGMTVERLAYKPLRGASPLSVLITAIGVSYLFQSLAQIIFGVAPKTLIKLQLRGFVELGSLRIDYSTLLTLAATAAVMVALTQLVIS